VHANAGTAGHRAHTCGLHKAYAGEIALEAGEEWAEGEEAWTFAEDGSDADVELSAVDVQQLLRDAPQVEAWLDDALVDSVSLTPMRM